MMNRGRGREGRSKGKGTSKSEEEGIEGKMVESILLCVCLSMV